MSSVKAAMERGFSVRAWGIKDPVELDRLVEIGVGGATVDWPDVARDRLAGLLKT